MPRLTFVLTVALAVLANTRAPAQSTSPPADFLVAPGVDTVRRHCTLCHRASMITPRHMTARRWGSLVDQMISRGAKVSDEDYKVIVAYLAQNYGPIP